MPETLNGPRNSGVPHQSFLRPGILRRFFNHLRLGSGGRLRFQKYRVAPRLGTDNVRRKILAQLHIQSPVATNETAVA